MKRALITQRQKIDSHGEAIDVLERAYVAYFEMLGYTVIPVPNHTANLKDYWRLGVDLVVLSGGGDVPGKYCIPQNNDVDSPERDEIESQLLRGAIDRRIPIIAICRGMQLVNGILGGFVSHLKELKIARPVGQEHPILLNGEVMQVNNFHNDGIYKQHLAKGLTPIGMDVENDVVEVYESKTLHILGLQCHPERAMTDGLSRQIIDELIRNFLQ
mgnify:CR=1 FL=1